MPVITLTNGDDAPSAYGDGDYTIYALDGNDNIDIGIGNSSISGGDGNDKLTAGAGNITLNGGNGNDLLTLYINSTVSAVIDGGTGNDTLIYYPTKATYGSVVIADMGDGDNRVNLGFNQLGQSKVIAGDGKNYITIGAGSTNNVTLGNGENLLDVSGTGECKNTLIFGDGNNTISTRNGEDYIYLGNGNNNISCENGNKYISADGKIGSNEVSIYGFGNHKVFLGSGADAITLGDGNSTIFSGAGNDVIKIVNVGNSSGTIVHDTHAINTDGGDDQVFIKGGCSAQINTGIGDDLVTISSITSINDDSFIFALGEGNNTLNGENSRGATSVTAFHGNNDIKLGFGNNSVTVGNGGNTISTEHSARTGSYYGTANDTITSGRGDDIIWSGGGNDRIKAGFGNDSITLQGGAGDLIIFDTGSTASNIDYVYGATAGIGLQINGTATLQLINGTVVAYSDALNQMIFVGLTNINGVTLY